LEECFQNLLLKENAMVSADLVSVTDTEVDVCKTREERKKTIWLPLSLGMWVMVYVGSLFGKDDPQRFVWFGRAAASNRKSVSFLNEMSDQIRNFNHGTGSAKVVFIIGRALKGQVDNEKQTIF
jgi:hypothetical protein